LGKKGLPDTLTAIAQAHPDKQIALWFQDEARVGQKGRTCHAWWLRGQRPPGLADKRFSFAYIFAAVQPVTGQSACLVLPEVSTAAMQVFLDSFSATLAPEVHAALVVDGAGWHTSLALHVPDNVTLVPLPPYAPELNPVERVWLYLRERFLSHRLHPDYNAVLDAACDACRRLTPERLRSLTDYPWLKRVSS
jgi:DDE superfamily endonuclease